MGYHELRSYFTLLGLLLAPVTVPVIAHAQENAVTATTEAKASTSTDGATTAAPDAAQAKAAFEEKFKEYKAALRDIEQLRIQYQTADEATRKKINADLQATLLTLNR